MPDPICIICKQVLKPDTIPPVCTKHIPQNKFEFVYKNIYVKLKQRTDDLIRAQTDNVIKYVFSGMIANVHLSAKFMNEPTQYSHKEFEERFVDFYHKAELTGYSALRIVDAIPDAPIKIARVVENQYKRKTKQIPSSFMTIAEKFLELIEAEYNSLYFMSFYVENYFEIAIDDFDSPKKLALWATPTDQSISHIIALRLLDSNESWQSAFDSIPHPSELIPVSSPTGQRLEISKTELRDNFKLFKEIWKKHFGREFPGDHSLFNGMRDLFRWVAWPGLNEETLDLVPYLKKKESGYEKSLLISVLDSVLPELCQHKSRISAKDIVEKMRKFELPHEMVSIGSAFRVGNVKSQKTYFIPAIHWFMNKITPVLLELIGRCNLGGSVFEKLVERFIRIYDHGYEITQDPSTIFGVFVGPRMKEPSEQPSWLKPRLVEKNYIILGSEIDFILYANRSLYLLETKSIDKDSNYAKKYLAQKGPQQCARYAEWLRNRKEFEKFLSDHSIKPHEVHAVRILIVSNGAVPSFIATHSPTGEQFAVVPPHVLFSICAGIIPSAIIRAFPTKVFADIESIYPNVEFLVEERLEERFKSAVWKEIRYWIDLALFDRRQQFKKPSKEMVSPIFSFKNLRIESYVEGQTGWILKTRVFLGESDSWKFYLGTQLGDVGSTYSCRKCRVAVRFYFRDDKQYERLIEYARKATCDVCGSLLEYETNVEITKLIVGLCLDYKRRTDPIK